MSSVFLSTGCALSRKIDIIYAIRAAASLMTTITLYVVYGFFFEVML
ncbi:Protein of unknown function [Anaplasma phagocytophilum]|uniref:Uncharacterized protein n=1 Tax=Anaplasma phagocytophilum TaxID=948 RepID=A0A098EFZ2_ANAPH|nr:Protein of unknown function [Anaplasma phagocytophilum]